MLGVVVFVASGPHFFESTYCINCGVGEFCAYTGIDSLEELGLVEFEELVEFKDGILISKPVYLERQFAGGSDIMGTLSHTGILAVSSYFDRYVIQFTDLLKERRSEVPVKKQSTIGFYDDKSILLSCGYPLSGCVTEDVFSKPFNTIFQQLSNVSGINCYTDVSLLNSTRRIFFKTRLRKAYVYNVDRRVCDELILERQIWSFATLTGIDVGVNCVFHEHGFNDFTCSLNSDYSVTEVLKFNPFWDLRMVIPSSSEPKNLHKAMKLYTNRKFYIDDAEGVELTHPFRYQGGNSIIRLYRNIFLVFDDALKKWALVKIIIP